MQPTVTRSSRSRKTAKSAAKKTRAPGGEKAKSSHPPAAKRPKTGGLTPPHAKKRTVKALPAAPAKRKPQAKIAVMTKKTVAAQPAAKKKIKSAKEKAAETVKSSAAQESHPSGDGVLKPEKRSSRRRVSAEPAAPPRSRKKLPPDSEPIKALFEPPLVPPVEEFGAVADFIEEDALEPEVDEELIGGELELDHLEIPIELLDPNLVDVPKPATPPKPKPKPLASERRERACAACGQMFFWLSVEGLCFSCLKRRLAQRRREDETVPTYEAPPEEEEES